MSYNEFHVQVFHYPENINISFTLKASIYPVSLCFFFFFVFAFDTESQYIAFTKTEVIV